MLRERIKSTLATYAKALLMSTKNIFLYARLKNGMYYVTGYGVRPSVNFFVSGKLLQQFTSDQAETWYIVRPWCGAAHIVSELQSTKCLQSYDPLKRKCCHY